MKYVNLGRSGLKVSRLCLGCMSYGEPERLPQPWSLDEKASRPLIRQALEAGINFFDTANTYSDGSSEEITGKALREMARRDEIVVATKTFFPWRNSPTPDADTQGKRSSPARPVCRDLRSGSPHLPPAHRWPGSLRQAGTSSHPQQRPANAVVHRRLSPLSCRSGSSSESGPPPADCDNG